jgi:hypothetical protein
VVWAPNVSAASSALLPREPISVGLSAQTGNHGCWGEESFSIYLQDFHEKDLWEEGWKAVPTPAPPTTPKLIPVITTGQGMEAVELAQTYEQHWVELSLQLRRTQIYLPHHLNVLYYLYEYERSCRYYYGR